MELIKEVDGKRIYKDGDTTYLFVNMGAYIGSKNEFKPWQGEPREEWYLMGMDEEVDGKRKSVDALIDKNGNYIRLTLSDNNIDRIVNLNYNCVISDEINDKSNGKDIMGLGTMYSAYDNPVSTITFDEYSAMEHVFKDGKGSVYGGVIPSDDKIIDFVSKNREMRKEFNGSKNL